MIRQTVFQGERVQLSNPSKGISLEVVGDGNFEPQALELFERSSADTQAFTGLNDSRVKGLVEHLRSATLSGTDDEVTSQSLQNILGEGWDQSRVTIQDGRLASIKAVGPETEGSEGFQSLEAKVTGNVISASLFMRASANGAADIGAMKNVWQTIDADFHADTGQVVPGSLQETFEAEYRLKA